ncbi:hypothetical protein LOK49_LG03G02555 [Camellia lanceoleosa]|uniref:Uncharacterized protein n=1 Tax=Camellia lanceoleosa TaxID=1840588 RepID=A0ACC0IA41_9ERIC|nr:hypothetical protein LOK49_LG03G02555 [Camellia lanceoleosa]
MVAPLEIHEENLIDVEEQLRFLIHAVQAAKISYLLPLLKGSFSSWIWNSLGILPGSIFPSVRCGLEMAILNAIAASEARRPDPIEDAMVIQEVRKKVGHQINLCADANRKRTYEETVLFGSSVMNCGLQYIEEPIQDEEDIIKFYEEIGLPVTLVATIENIQENSLEMLAMFTHSGVVAVVFDSFCAVVLDTVSFCAVVVV